MDDDTGKHMIDLADYYSGGYFLIRADKPEWQNSQLLPDKLISLSECICPRVCVWWGFHPGDREAPLRFGIPESHLEAFLEWCGYGHQVDIEHPSMFYSVDAARRFVARFLPNTDGLYLIGAGLHQSVAETDWTYPYARDGNTSAIDGRIKQQLPLEAGGEPLGFEVICFAYNDLAESWTCNGLQETVDDLLSIKPGQFGLIQSREQAETVCNWIMKEGIPPAEPEPYAYWLLVSYPLTS